jgi:hypothetical protein
MRVVVRWWELLGEVRGAGLGVVRERSTKRLDQR